MVDILHPLTETLVTGQALAEMGDIGRCELVEGRIIKMSPTGWRHGKHESRFDYHLTNFLDDHDLGEVFVGEVGIYTRRNPDTVRGADVVYISHERLSKVKSSSFLDVAPELVVEIMSPDDRWSNVQQKLAEYFDIGVILVWVADPTAKTVSVYRSLTDVRIFTEQDTVTGDEVLPGFELPVAAIFAD
jgi:Uma2 family endonuclease